MGKAYLYWKEEKYLNACIRCGELIWVRFFNIFSAFDLF